MVYINTHQERYTKECGKIICTTVWVTILSLMEQFMKENGKIIGCMEKVYSLIKIKKNGKENLSVEIINQKCKNNLKWKK
ncbi:UNVERIFIED_CONTAM: hypothetical protein GTU68_002499 [Idotea baltica]|nr:hypothetical protein [Idotea baltica]